MKLISFPEMFPDEDLRSILYRYHVRSGNATYKETRYQIFGINSCALIPFPRGIGHLIDKLPINNNFTLEYFLYKHTWYGLFKAFITSTRHKQNYQLFKYGLLEGQTNKHKGRIYASTRSILSSVVKYCPACIYDDIHTFGEIYVHREHQVSFLVTCDRHSARLISKCPICNTNLTNEKTGILLKRPMCRNGHTIPIEYQKNMGTEYKLEISLLHDLLYLRENHHYITIDDIIFRFKEHLFEKGYITMKGEIQKKNLISDFINSKFGLLLKNKELDNVYFKNRFLDREIMVKYMDFYLLLVRFLCDSFKDFISRKIPISIDIPFGTGPWKCGNPNCENYEVPLISICKRHLVNGRRGIYHMEFLCITCDYNTVIEGSPTSYRIRIKKG
ncbi:TnsD family transposase [Paenibacillus sp. Lou8.1]|uniref:TnsD family Tn7-like transposition protein n=1 Tax=Paenibacillus sp. Lou8.1 TaxID=2962041 RepID=UPI0020B7AE6B|nr:TnsD family Tn7-like transposition protein [Paenibacillus sp. Lou8.1]MCP3808113.1 TnsD family transposase [Paenibacillus sp. Lou8.1]